MKVMVYLGKATPKVVNGLKSMSDDNDYMVYTSVSNFVQEAELRHLSFSRIIFNNKFVPQGEKDFIALNEFIRNFSSGTELVMVINEGDKVNEGLFNKYFSSPMHSCAIVKSAASMDFFRDIVSLPIVTVKARYYELDKGNSEKAKDSKIGGLKGGVKKSTETVETAPSDTSVSEPTSNMESFSRNSLEDSAIENAANVMSNGVSIPPSVSPMSGNSEIVPGFTSEASALLEPSSSSGEDFVTEDEEDILSVGAFGSAHSDTDMFDEEDDPGEVIEEPENNPVDEEEQRRRTELEEQNRIAAEIQERNRLEAINKENIGNAKKSEIARQRVWGNLNGTPYKANCLNFIVGVTGSGSAQQIVDDAVRMMEAGMRILIVDMDFVNNGILSFIDTDGYYAKGHNGYKQESIYVEEGIGVLSGGYGFFPSFDDVRDVLSSVSEGYDIIIVDCPIPSLHLLDIKILECNNIIVFSGNDPSQITATAIALTDRDNCTLGLERLIMGSGTPLVAGGETDLVKKTVSSMLFANGCWLQ